MIPQDEIKKIKHIVVEYDKNHFIQASILYSYMLSLHKKVSLYGAEEVSRYAFLPWYEKSRLQKPVSADFYFSVNNIELLDLYFYFKENKIKINKKIATAFFAGFLEQYENFLSSACYGTIFAIVSELIEYGAERQLCIEELTQKIPLRIFRLKAIAYKKLLLQQNGEVAYVDLDEKDFITTGAQWCDVDFIAKEILSLVNVKEVMIIKNDEKNKIINLKKEVYFEKKK